MTKKVSVAAPLRGLAISTKKALYELGAKRLKGSGESGPQRPIGAVSTVTGVSHLHKKKHSVRVLFLWR